MAYKDPGAAYYEDRIASACSQAAQTSRGGDALTEVVRQGFLGNLSCSE